MAKKRVVRPPSSGEGGNMGEGNGGADQKKGAIVGAQREVRHGGRSKTNIDPATQGEDRDNGNREAVSRAALDKVYTADSKDVWGENQPSLQDLLKEKGKIDAAVEGRDPPAEEEEAEEEAE